MSNFVSINNVSKTYNEGSIETPVLKALDLNIQKGEQIAIVGSSGSGKSTLLHILGTLDHPTSGEVKINDIDVAKLNSNQLAEFRNEHLGFIYQFHHLLMDFTALENVCMPLMIRNTDSKQAEITAKDMLTKVGLAHRIDHKPSELSGGERQRVAIARALVTKPSLILADEPTGNLDHQNALNIYELLNELNSEFNTTFIVVTHDMELAQKMDRVLTLVNGSTANMTKASVSPIKDDI